jgi:chaperone protein EcpD
LGKPEDAPAQLDWKVVDAPDGKGLGLRVSNPTSYYVSFSEIDIVSDGQTYKNETGGMVAPRGTEVFPVPRLSSTSADATVHYTAISDFGGALKGDAKLGR